MLAIVRCLKMEETIAQERLRRRPASMRGLDDCVYCGLCCWRKTCEIAPSEITALAATRGLSEREMFWQCCVVDEYNGQLLVRPRLPQQCGGQFLSDEQTWDVGKCVLMSDDGKCSVHDVKPQSAREGGCYKANHDSRTGATWTPAQLAALGWNGRR
jgi:hypothetical protein